MNDEQNANQPLFPIAIDKTQEHDWEHADIEEYTLNYCWELQRVLTEQDKPVNVIDPSTLFVRGHSVE